VLTQFGPSARAAFAAGRCVCRRLRCLFAHLGGVGLGCVSPCATGEYSHFLWAERRDSAREMLLDLRVRLARQARPWPTLLPALPGFPSHSVRRCAAAKWATVSCAQSRRCIKARREWNGRQRDVALVGTRDLHAVSVPKRERPQVSPHLSRNRHEWERA
jgi:hypothetical protein